jgi:altronate dehydratase
VCFFRNGYEHFSNLLGVMLVGLGLEHGYYFQSAWLQGRQKKVHRIPS